MDECNLKNILYWRNPRQTSSQSLGVRAIQDWCSYLSPICQQKHTVPPAGTEERIHAAGWWWAACTNEMLFFLTVTQILVFYYFDGVSRSKNEMQNSKELKNKGGSRSKFGKFSVSNGSFEYFTGLLKTVRRFSTTARGKMKGRGSLNPVKNFSPKDERWWRN